MKRFVAVSAMFLGLGVLVHGTRTGVVKTVHGVIRVVTFGKK